jgi:hypothetical protein
MAMEHISEFTKDYLKRFEDPRSLDTKVFDTIKSLTKKYYNDDLAEFCLDIIDFVKRKYGQNS